MRPQSISEVASRILAGAEIQIPVKEFIDEFRYRTETSIDTLDVSDMIGDEPAMTGDAVSDVYLAGLAEYIAFRTKVPAPPWAESPSRFLKEPVFMGGKHSREYMLVKTTFAMRRRLLFCGEVSL